MLILTLAILSKGMGMIALSKKLMSIITIFIASKLLKTKIYLK